MERRVLRRAAEQALMIPMFQQPVDAAPAQEASAPLAYVGGDREFDYRWGDPDDNDGWNGHERVAEPTSVGEVHDLLREQPDFNLRDEPDEIPWDAGHAPPLGDGRLGTPNISMLTADCRPRAWYRTKQAVTVFAATAVAAIVVWGVLFVLRSPGTGAEDSTTVAPNASTTARPAPTSAQPSRASAPLPPPAPPPPPSAAQIDPAPVVTGQNPWPRPAAPSQTEKPQIGVTRTPATRAPISAAPPPRPAPGTNSATPGDAPKHRWGPW
jgi:hypothetical protein